MAAMDDTYEHHQSVYPVPVTGASLGLMTHLALLRDLPPMPCGQEHPGKVFLLESKANINLGCVTQATMTMKCARLRTTFSSSSSVIRVQER